MTTPIEDDSSSKIAPQPQQIPKLMEQQPAVERRAAEPKRLGRMRALDALRFIAAVGVMLYHFTAARGVVWSADPKEVFPELAPWTAYGAIGPELFFIVSGFVILMTAWGRSARYYVASRVSRIFPAYWLAVLLTGLLLLRVWPDGKSIGVGQWLLNFTLVQDVFDVHNIDSVYWTLWAELRFYALILILLLIGINRRSVIAFTIIVPAIGITAMHTGFEITSMLFIGPYVAFFMVGMLMYLIRRDGGTWFTWALLLVNLTAGIIIRVRRHVIMLPDRLGWEPSVPLLALLMVACAVSVWIVTSPRLAGIKWKWLTTLGAITYPLYLMHQHWGWWVISQVRHVLSPLLAVSLALVVSFVLAILIYQFVEKPLNPRFRALLSGKRVKSPDAGTR